MPKITLGTLGMKLFKLKLFKPKYSQNFLGMKLFILEPKKIGPFGHKIVQPNICPKKSGHLGITQFKLNPKRLSILGINPKLPNWYIIILGPNSILPKYLVLIIFGQMSFMAKNSNLPKPKINI